MQGHSMNRPDHGQRVVPRGMNRPVYDHSQVAVTSREVQVIGGLLHGLPIAMFLWIGLIGASTLIF